MTMQQYQHCGFSLLDQALEQEGRGFGLYSGLAGYTITYFLLEKHTGDPRFASKGHQLLDVIAENIVEVKALDFSIGLAGIGWSIEWLKQNDLLEVNTDEVLEEVDDIMYKTAIGSSNNNISLEQGILGKAVYFLRRYQSQNAGTHRFRRVGHHECLVILTDDLKVKICNENQLFGKVTNTNDWIIAAQVLLFLGDLWTHKLNMEAVEVTIYYVIEHALQLLEEHCGTKKTAIYTAEELHSFQYFAYALYWIGKQLSCRSWCERAFSYLELFLLGKNQKHDLTGHMIHALLKSILSSDELERLSRPSICFDFLNEYNPEQPNLSEVFLTIIALSDPGLTHWRELLRPCSFSLTQEISAKDKGMLFN